MKITDIVGATPAFKVSLTEKRSRIEGINWYPYGSLSSVHVLASFIPETADFVPDGGAIIDIGAADGDIGFLFHSLGCDVDFLDNAPTNFNNCRAILATSKALGHTGRLIQTDIDLGFELDRDYDLAIFLGALYHLRNPALALVRIAQRCRTMVLSTRVMSHLPSGEFVGNYPIAYVLNSDEANGDPTNWWVFSNEGLTRLLKRCGWTVTASKNFGAINKSNPSDHDADERKFLYCERVSNYSELLIHHDF